MKKLLFILVFLSLITLVLTGLAMILKGPSKLIKENEIQTKVKIENPLKQQLKTVLVSTEIIPATVAGTPVNVKIAIKPQGDGITLTAFDLRLLIRVKTGNVKTGGAVKISNDLLKFDWSFPIKRAKIEGEMTVVELSGLHLVPEVYNLREEQVLATVPVMISSGEVLIIGLDEQITQFIDNKSLKLNSAYEQK